MITVYDADGLEIEIPKKFEVCPRCEGAGKHTNPSIDGNGLSREDFDADPDFEEDYFNGVYDVSCEECHGKRVIEVGDLEAMTDEVREAYKAAVEWEVNYAEERAHEIRMGY